MKLSRRKMELMLVDIAIIICVYYMTNLVKVLRLHSIVLNGEINLSRMLALVVTIMAGRIVFGVYRNIWRHAINNNQRIRISYSRNSTNMDCC